MLLAERTQDTGSIPQIENNLRSLQLANVAGYSFPNSRGQVAPWLASWGQVVGKSGILLILLEQGALQVPEYQAVVDALE